MNSTKSWKKPTPEQVAKATLQLARQAHYRYFFDRLENPEWVEPLWKAKLFTKPPDVIRDESQGTVQFPPWPESQYLARMAGHKPDLVKEIIKRIPANGNPLVYENLVQAALAMPADVAADLIEVAINWTQPAYQLTFLAERFGALAAHLARGGKTKEALRLAQALLAVVPDPRSDDSELPILPEPRARFDLWHYEQILKKNIPELVANAGTDVLSLLCNLLDQAIKLSHRQPRNEGSEDLSYIWHPAVEDHEQNQLPLIKSLLVSAVRDAATQIIRTDVGMLPSVIEALEARRPAWSIFTRVALYALNVFLDGPDSLTIAARFLTQRELFDDLHYRHEYVLVLRQYFARLTGDRQEMILDWIAKPPPPEYFKANYESWAQSHKNWPFDKKMTDEQAAQEQRRWQFIRLSWFEARVPASMKALYEKLAQEFPAEKHIEFPHYVQQFVGPSSPVKPEDIREMPVETLVSYLRDWKPSRDFMGDSREGLGRELTSVIADDPERFARHAQAFSVCHPTYVRSLLHGLRDAIGKGRAFEWKPVLDLCSWILSQADADVLNEVPYWVEEDRDWTWTRNAIAYLLEVAMSGDKGKIPFELRDDVWRLLGPLSDDPDPKPDREARQLESNSAPSEISINATRGVAMHAIVHYAIWVRNSLEKAKTGGATPTFVEMPEVRDVLDKHLALDLEPSLSIRSIYGRWFPWLHQIDSKWVADNARRIFPDDPNTWLYWEAAWSTYLAFCPAYDDVFLTLRPQYALAIERLGKPARLKARGADLKGNLAAHLMGMYWRGKLHLDDPLLVGFFAHAPVEARAYALEAIGRWLFESKKTDRPPDAELLARLTRLWECRLAEARSSESKIQYSREMASFVEWFRSAVFDDTWAISQLEEALALAALDTRALDRFSYGILERLAEVCAAFPDEAIRCLERLAQAKEETLHVFLNREPVRAVLSSAMSKGGEAAQTATRLINELGKRGVSDYRDLLR